MNIKYKFRPSTELMKAYEHYMLSYHNDFRLFESKGFADEIDYIPSAKAKKIAKTYLELHKKELEEYFFSEME